MKTEVINQKQFKPVEVKLTIESQEELNCLYAIVNAVGSSSLRDEIISVNDQYAGQLDTKQMQYLSESIYEAIKPLIKLS